MAPSQSAGRVVPRAGADRREGQVSNYIARGRSVLVDLWSAVGGERRNRHELHDGRLSAGADASSAARSCEGDLNCTTREDIGSCLRQDWARGSRESGPDVDSGRPPLSAGGSESFKRPLWPTRQKGPWRVWAANGTMNRSPKPEGCVVRDASEWRTAGTIRWQGQCVPKTWRNVWPDAQGSRAPHHGHPELEANS